MQLSGYNARAEQPEVMVRDLDSGQMVPASTLGSETLGSPLPQTTLSLSPLLALGMPQFEAEDEGRRMPKQATAEVASSLNNMLAGQATVFGLLNNPRSLSHPCS